MKAFLLRILCLVVLTSTSTVFAAKEVFQRTKPHVNVGTIGHVDHGKTTLTAALSKAGMRPLLGSVVRYEDLGGTGVIEINTSNTTFRTTHPQYHIYDFDEEGTVKNLVTGAWHQDGAILVVSAADGPMPQTREHILLARQVGVPALVVFLNTDFGGDDPMTLASVEAEIRTLLSCEGYDGPNAPVVTGSTLCALMDQPDDLLALADLADALDGFIPIPTKPADKPFLMPIEDVFSISGRGTVVTGRIETGRIQTGQDIEIVGLSETVISSAVDSIVINGSGQSDAAEADDQVEILLRGVQREEVERGQVLAKPGSITPATRFKARAYVLTPAEGGNSAPFFHGYRPQFYFRTTDVTGEIQLPSPYELVVPGDNVDMTVELITPIAINEGLRFAIREGGRTVGVGHVIETLP